MFLVSSCSCLCPIHWSQMSSWEWRCRWSSADRRCSNYIWAINNFIAYQGGSYIRDFTVRFPVFTSLSSDLYMAYYNKFYLGTVVSWSFCEHRRVLFINLKNLNLLTHWGRDKMDAISQTTFSSAFYWMKMYELRLKIHWSLFLRVQLTIFQHWFR